MFWCILVGRSCCEALSWGPVEILLRLGVEKFLAFAEVEGSGRIIGSGECVEKLAAPLRPKNTGEGLFIWNDVF